MTFYEKIRKSYNSKKSNLYINIVKEIEDRPDFYFEHRCFDFLNILRRINYEF